MEAYGRYTLHNFFLLVGIPITISLVVAYSPDVMSRLPELNWRHPINLSILVMTGFCHKGDYVLPIAYTIQVLYRVRDEHRRVILVVLCAAMGLAIRIFILQESIFFVVGEWVFLLLGLLDGHVMAVVSCVVLVRLVMRAWEYGRMIGNPLPLT